MTHNQPFLPPKQLLHLQETPCEKFSSDPLPSSFGYIFDLNRRLFPFRERTGDQKVGFGKEVRKNQMGLFFYNPSETSTPPARIHCCSIQAGETKVFESKASQLSHMQMVAPAPRGTMAETPPMPMPLAETATHFARFLHENRRREAMPASLPGKYRRRRGENACSRACEKPTAERAAHDGPKSTPNHTSGDSRRQFSCFSKGSGASVRSSARHLNARRASLFAASDALPLRQGACHRFDRVHAHRFGADRQKRRESHLSPHFLTRTK